LQRVAPLFRRGFASKAAELAPSFLADLRQILGVERVATGATVRAQHGQDAGPHSGASPQAVVWPETRDQVSAVCQLCNDARMPLVPVGSGTGLEGGIVAVEGGIALVVTGMSDLVGLWPEDFTAAVQPGVTREGLNAALRGSGLWFPVDPGADASICGMCATGASGTNAVRYGTMKENCVNLEVVLANGKVIETAGHGARPRKTSAGYNLTELFLGSEGTLGVITQATVRLHPLPECVMAAVVAFPSLQDAVNTVVATLQAAVPIARIELLDEVQMAACNQYSKLGLPESPTLFIEFHGTHAGVAEQVEVVRGVAKENMGGEFSWAEKVEDRNRLWKARHSANPANMAFAPGKRLLATDVCVPISSLPEVVLAAKEDILRNGLTGPIVGHAGDGNFHASLMFDPMDARESEACHEVAERMARQALEVGGTVTGEHGVGLGKVGLLEEQFGEDGVGVMRNIKRALDPRHILNPGKVIKAAAHT